MLLRWVALHEVTHALQFAGVPWLRPHLPGSSASCSRAVEVDPRCALRLPDAADLRALVDAVREAASSRSSLGPEQRAMLDRLQTTMAVIEGHAEHVMDAVGAQVLPDLERLRGALGRRRRDRSGLLRLLERLLGLELKLRQYEQGKRVLRRRRPARRDRGAQPRVGGPEAPADARRARRSGRGWLDCAAPAPLSPRSWPRGSAAFGVTRSGLSGVYKQMFDGTLTK